MKKFMILIVAFTAIGLLDARCYSPRCRETTRISNINEKVCPDAYADYVARVAQIEADYAKNGDYEVYEAALQDAEYDFQHDCNQETFALPTQ